MVAPLVAAAGISAAGSLISGLTGGKGAKKAAKMQARTAREQIAAQERARDQVLSLEQPTINRGNAAGGLVGSFLGLEGGDAAAGALSTFRGSTGYQDLMSAGLGAVNSNAYARGMGASGATLKALQAKGAAIADQSAGSWLSNLGGLAQMGRQAVGNVSGVIQNTTNNINQNRQGAADASSNAALIGSANGVRALQNAGNAALWAGSMGGGGLGSSYGGGVTTPGFGGGVNPNSPLFRLGRGGI